MKSGILFFDDETERFDFEYSLGEFYGGFHCGESLEIEINDEWVSTSFEFFEDWFLVGFPDITLDGLCCRVA